MQFLKKIAKQLTQKINFTHTPKSKNRFKFKINQKVSLQPIGIKKKLVYQSYIADASEDTITIALPLEKGIYVNIEANDFLKVTIYDNSGMYYFTGKIISRYIGNIPLLTLEKPEQITKFQQRRFIRSKVYWQVRYALIKGSRMPTLMEMKTANQVWARDISEGGICLVIPKHLLNKVNYGLLITMEEYGRAVRVLSKMSRIKIDEFSVNYLVGMEFNYIKSKDKEYISDYVLSTEGG
ncbi:MAG: hypothetical protein DRP78_01695 [Candidatus Omnitrophota bacterium]|nr:MAG: hypothetical protein DRP78_01695 [Candidatus Omnitrophota bacterium]